MVGEWNMSMEHWWNDTDRRKPKVLGEKLVPDLLPPLHIPHGLAWDRTLSVRFERPTTNGLNHATTFHAKNRILRFCDISEPKVAVKLVALPFCIMEVLGAYVGHDTC
jgi:hypothetical protein